MDYYLKHYGMPRRSGRYPWGSGDNPYQRGIGYREYINRLKKQGLTEKEIAEKENISINQLRTRMTVTKDDIRAANRVEALRLKDKGYSATEIARLMSNEKKTWNESSIRSLLDPVLAERASITITTANVLKESIKNNRYIDIGLGVENSLGVNRSRLNTAVGLLIDEGYKVHTVKLPQPGSPGQFTYQKVLGAPDTEWKEVVNNFDLIKPIQGYSEDYGRTFKILLDPIKNVDPNRVKVIYSEDGGNLKDGVIELRRGVDDLNLGQSQYAQVRISVGGTHFLKGMAIYNDNMPLGIDILFNTNKHKDVPMMGPKDNTVLKNLKADPFSPDNPFGATIKRQNGALNIVNEEGDWDNWSKTLSSQILSKQPVPLAKQQLNLALSEKNEEFEEYMSVTNPVVKKKLLLSFGDDCDSSAVDLKAAALPRQASKVILPITSLKENEIYAPGFNNGETVVLFRHPHGGIFEIPRVIVNNKSKAAQSIMKNARDAIGIHPVVAQKLSGADFDGDSVIIIPDNKGLIKNSNSLKNLKNFDPIESYRIPKGSSIKPIKEKTRQKEMGVVSNLITDMTIKGADFDEIAKAVKHSMVVIDSEKHNLNYRQSYIDNGIEALQNKYQKEGGTKGGASTLISRAGSEIRVDEYKARKAKEGGPIDPETGKKIYIKTGNFFIDEKGRTHTMKTKSTQMAETEDAFILSSGRQIEEVYAKFANDLKELGNRARREALKVVPIKYSPSAAIAYKPEVDSLNRKLFNAFSNKPNERTALRVANVNIKRKQELDRNMTKEDLKKLRNQSLASARVLVGAHRNLVNIEPKEWSAIQAGAISTSKLTQIIDNADLKQVKQYATPRNTKKLSLSKITRAKAMFSNGYTQAEVAEQLGVSTSFLMKSINE